MTTMNATQSISSLSGTAGGWGISIIVFIAIIVLLFILSKNIRQFFYGGIVTVILGTIGWVAKGIGFSASEGDMVPITWFIGIGVFILTSVGIGRLLMKTEFIKRFEGGFDIGLEVPKVVKK